MAILLVSLESTSHFWHRDAHSSHAMNCNMVSSSCWAGPRSPSVWIIRVSVPSPRLAAPTPNVCLHLIHIVTEKDSMFLEQMMEKQENSLEKSEKSRHGKGQALRTREESQGVPSKQNLLRLSIWVSPECWHLTQDSLLMPACCCFEFVLFHSCTT